MISKHSKEILKLAVVLTGALDIPIYGGVKRGNNGIGNALACYLWILMV
jgi:hypothetical protein